MTKNEGVLIVTNRDRVIIGNPLYHEDMRPLPNYDVRDVSNPKEHAFTQYFFVFIFISSIIMEVILLIVTIANLLAGDVTKAIFSGILLAAFLTFTLYAGSKL